MSFKQGQNIVVVGGGAGGLELVTKLGRKLGSKGKAQITLIDSSPTHIWKPLLHEVATGALDPGLTSLNYRSHSLYNSYKFMLGSLTGINRGRKYITLSPVLGDMGQEVLPEQTIKYDILVVSIGSISNDFNTPGVSDNCIPLDSTQNACEFHNKLVNKFIHFENVNNESPSVNVVIVGGGATGIELAAELYHTVDNLSHYGFKKLNTQSLEITVIEASDRILPPLPSRISTAVLRDISPMGINVKTNTLVTKACDGGLETRGGEFIPADLIVWAAGIKAADILNHLDGLETNRINQLIVRKTLQTTVDESVFAIGDCCSCPLTEDKFVPPRAQSAHQMASHAYKNILAILKGTPLSDYVYRDYGSLVSVSQYGTVGTLLSKKGRPLYIEGVVAKLVYLSLQQIHQVALYGYFKTAALILLSRINRVFHPKVKLH